MEKALRNVLILIFAEKQLPLYANERFKYKVQINNSLIQNKA